MNRNAHILIVEDDPEIGTLIQRHLVANGWRASVARNGQAMDRLLASARIDLVILDIMLPGEDGISICRRLRVASTLPIIIVSAKNDDVDRVVGLEMGADDYLAKPFNPRELIARVRALLRRIEMGAKAPTATGKVLSFEGWKMDLTLRTLENPEGALTILTPREFDLLRVLCERYGRILNRDQLIDLTQGQIGPTNGRNIDILISRLRTKLEAGGATYQFIRTVRSGGYEFVPAVSTASAE